jgi:hypothetical protein
MAGDTGTLQDGVSLFTGSLDQEGIFTPGTNQDMGLSPTDKDTL